MRRRYTDQGAGTYSKHDELTMSFGGSRLPSVAYSKNNSYICSEHYNRINGSLTSVTMNTGDTIWTMRKQLSRLLPTKVGSGKLETSLSCDLRGNVTVIDQNGALKEINNYYPYGGLMGGAVTGIQPDKYGGKELDRENGIDWYDFEARYQDPMLPMFTTQDPLAENNPDISPYAYCAGNPIRYIDPSGMLWIKSQWGDDIYYMFDKDINSQSDIVTKYGKDANYSLIGENYDNIHVDIKHRNGEHVRDVLLSKEGSIQLNGVAVKEYNYSTVHFSNLSTYTFNRNSFTKYIFGLERNYFNSFYVGNRNPQINGKDSYTLPPINLLDFAAQQHDQDYNRINAAGISGVLSMRTLPADLRLTQRSAFAAQCSDFASKEQVDAIATSMLFNRISKVKIGILEFWLLLTALKE